MLVRHTRKLVFVCACVLMTTRCGRAQQMDEKVRAVTNGGIMVSGWHGAIDAAEAKAGATINNSKLTKEAKGLHVTTGPATIYWNPGNKASGDYTVSAKFTEPKYMNLNDHPHPYGIFIGGNDLGTDQQSLLYCAAYGNGNFIVRGFGPAPFRLGNRAPEFNAAVHKAPAAGQPVTQQIAMTVKGDTVNCAINGTVVASFAKSDVVAAGKLKSTDGVYGIRFAHNTEGSVTALNEIQLK
jgi:hypothetical protein